MILLMAEKIQNMYNNNCLELKFVDAIQLLFQRKFTLLFHYKCDVSVFVTGNI